MRPFRREAERPECREHDVPRFLQLFELPRTQSSWSQLRAVTSRNRRPACSLVKLATLSLGLSIDEGERFVFGVIHTTVDGRLAHGAQEKADDWFARVRTAPKIVIHFHGGLVPSREAQRSAEHLAPLYEGAGAAPAFFVWESGLLEMLTKNLVRIGSDALFKLLLWRTTKFASAKVGRQPAGARGLVFPTDIEVHTELSRSSAREPYADLEVRPDVTDLTGEEEYLFRASLSEDRDLADITNVLSNQSSAPRAAMSPGHEVDSPLLSPEILETLEQEVHSNKGQRAVVSSAFFIGKGLRALWRVTRRFQLRRDHGLYPTVVEELLREFYMANAGGRVWTAMKERLRKAFAEDRSERGGTYLVSKLAELYASGARPQITVVGHSAGAIAVMELLARVRSWRDAGRLSPACTFENIAFLAPACTVSDIARLLESPYVEADGSGLYKNFRMYALNDAMEASDVIVPGVYPRSLLYLVSGLFESGPSAESAWDVPLLGMQRFFDRPEVYCDDPISSVRRFFDRESARVVWSPSVSAAPGLLSDARSHGGFVRDRLTLESVCHVIERRL